MLTECATVAVCVLVVCALGMGGVYACRWFREPVLLAHGKTLGDLMRTTPTLTRFGYDESLDTRAHAPAHGLVHALADWLRVRIVRRR